MVAERLCGSMPMTTRADVEPNGVLRCSIQLVVEPGGQRYFELSKPLLSLSPPWGDARCCAGQMRATRPAWAADVRATARAPRPSLARQRSYGNGTSSRCPDVCGE